MHRLEANGAVPHALEEGLLRTLRTRSALETLAAIAGSVGGEEGVAEDGARSAEEVVHRGHCVGGGLRLDSKWDGLWWDVRVESQVGRFGLLGAPGRKWNGRELRVEALTRSGLNFEVGDFVS